jgi:hypothetical protein
MAMAAGACPYDTVAIWLNQSNGAYGFGEVTSAPSSVVGVCLTLPAQQPD